MGMIGIDICCLGEDGCGAYDVKTLERDEATYEHRWDCAACGGINTARRVPSAPRNLRASFLDGNNRFADLKRAAKLESESMDKPPSERGEYKAEINRLRSTRK